MTDLMVPFSIRDDSEVVAEDVYVNLYCWPCKGVHNFPLPDVEQIVYVLGGDRCDDLSEEPACLSEVLRWASDSETYAEHAEQGVTCRKLEPS